MISSVLIIIPSIIVEVFIKRPNVVEAIFVHPTFIWIIMGGIFVTLFYQTSVVALTSISKALSVGALHQLLV